MSNRFLVATRKGLFTVERVASGRWEIAGTAFIGDNVSMALQDRRVGSIFAALDHGHFGVKLHRSRGLGETWEECSAPVYPKQPEGEIDKDSMGRVIPWTTLKIWSLETGGHDEPGVLWCGTIPGGLFRSADRGASWQMMRALWDTPKRKGWFGGGYDQPGIDSICVDPRDPKVVRVAISVGGVWTTRDGGASWENEYSGMYSVYMPPETREDPNTQDPHRMVQCQAQPDCLWVQHHNGIFRSRDGGSTWRDAPNAKPSAFGFAVAVHPRDAGRAWFAPAIKDELRIPVDGKLVVTRTQDGGETFETLSHGLPQVHAYDLIYRHGLEVDETGDRLAMGSTTGGLWVSEDQGERWQRVSQNLPPIYCVRFLS